MEQLLITKKEAADGKIRWVNIGSRVYFSPEDLRAFVKKGGHLC